MARNTNTVESEELFEGIKKTPMLNQYLEIKEKYNDCLLFYRLGDFYELFFEDARIVSKELGLVLTQKSTGMPMCGVPWHAHEMYLTKLIKKGYRVAICEQTETPEEARAKRGCKATVERKVIRVVTQGTLIESSLIDNKTNNYLLSISIGSPNDNNNIGLAYADISTGKFFVEEINKNDIMSSIEKISPSEIICPDKLLNNSDILSYLSHYRSIIHPLPNAKFVQSSSIKRLSDFYGVKFIDAFGNFSDHVLDAASAIVEYISSVYIETKINLSIPKMINSSDFMQIDFFTRKSLELQKTLSGDRKGSLLDNIDNTLTSPGSRLLTNWISSPLSNIDKINKRLDYIDFFMNNKSILSDIRSILSDFPDVERSCSRVFMEKSGPKDLNCVRFALAISKNIDKIISKYDILKPLSMTFEGMENLLHNLNNAMQDDVPNLVRDGNFIKKGYDRELDEYRDILQNSEFIIKGLQEKYVNLSQIQNLKIKHNNIIGYFIEISSNYMNKVPYEFIHRQTLASVMRYTTHELMTIANKIYSAESDTIRREFIIFEDLCRKIQFYKKYLENLCYKISFLDCVTSLSDLAIQRDYTRPEIVDEKIMSIKNGRHPVVEMSLSQMGENFVSNDCSMDEKSYISLLTGPNMGGKSTFLRQNAIIVILSHIGSYVPAESAKIGIVDKIFSRVGASDDIASGRSTFMVEMIETATILCQATEKSFVILDEIGRGTSTYDGLSIARAVVESIHDDIKCRTIFATHYHELKNLENTIKNLQFITVHVEEKNDNIIFMHKIKHGFANKSYGIHVASIAGVPQKVIKRAREILKELDMNKHIE